MNSHIKLMTNQNDELAREIDQFVSQNEKIRQQLDRKARVDSLRQKNEDHMIQSSKIFTRISSSSPDPIKKYL